MTSSNNDAHDNRQAPTTYADVIVPLAIEDTFTYSVPAAMRPTVRRGMMVSVPVGDSRCYAGIVMNVHDRKPQFSCKDIAAIVGDKPAVTDSQLRLWQWIADYFMAPIGDIFAAAMPAPTRRIMQKPAATRRGRTSQTAMMSAADTHSQISILNDAQSEAYNSILSSFKTKNVVLLHGVTSSGKTEIYIHLIQQALVAGKQALYLLPEIALTVQIRERLARVFGDKLGVYHSMTGDKERAAIWQRQLSNSPYGVILGARSAVLLPFQRLGLVIIDEEHDTSFKQQEPAPRYNARSVAIVLAQMQGAKTLLGTATPSAETIYNTQTGKYGIVTLTHRYEDMQLPEVKVVDLKDMYRRKMMTGPFSPQLISAIGDALSAHRQAILFQNRRGFAPLVICRDCGWTPRCACCDVPLTYHKRMNKMTCHYCGHTYDLPQVCPECGSHRLTTRGMGTEKIEESIAAVFPKARTARMDLDTALKSGSRESIINAFAAGETDILIGTQMITKGLDFDRVSVVGILNADTMLNMPDFRAYEHAYNMMSQVAGRAGRKDKRGLVILQTFSADLPLIDYVVRNDSAAFVNDMFAERKAFGYPPFTHIIYIYLRHRDGRILDNAAADMGTQLRRWLGDRVLGPDKPAVARVKGLCIRKIVVKIERGIDLAKVKDGLWQEARHINTTDPFRSVNIYFDVDPA